MEIIEKILSGNEMSFETVLLLLILLVVYSYFKVLKPIVTKFNSIPSIKEFTDITEKISGHEKDKIDLMQVKIDKILEIIDDVEDTVNDTDRCVLGIEKDIQQLKQILHQFQGRSMYGSNSDFGNKELK